jgi:hypothetical protein
MMEKLMYDRPPMWRLICEGGVNRRRLYCVATPTDSDMPMAFGVLQDNGQWTSDFEGKVPLSFVPQWYGEPPVYPPVPPPELLPAGHPWWGV